MLISDMTSLSLTYEQCQVAILLLFVVFENPLDAPRLIDPLDVPILIDPLDARMLCSNEPMSTHPVVG